MQLPHDTLVPAGSAESVFEASRIAGRLLSTEIRDDVSDSSAHEETDKARSLRTKHGSLGCRAGIALARGRFRRVLNDSTLFSRKRRFLRQPSGPCFVPSDRALSVS